MEFHDPSVESTTHYLEALESSSLAQILKLFPSPLFPTRVMSQHDNINMDNTLGGWACVWGHWKDALKKDYFPIVWKCLITILQDLQATSITPIMAYPLQ